MIPGETPALPRCLPVWGGGSCNLSLQLQHETALKKECKAALKQQHEAPRELVYDVAPTPRHSHHGCVVASPSHHEALLLVSLAGSARGSCCLGHSMRCIRTTGGHDRAGLAQQAQISRAAAHPLNRQHMGHAAHLAHV